MFERSGLTKLSVAEKDALIMALFDQLEAMSQTIAAAGAKMLEFCRFEIADGF